MKTFTGDVRTGSPVTEKYGNIHRKESLHQITSKLNVTFMLFHGCRTTTVPLLTSGYGLLCLKWIVENWHNVTWLDVIFPANLNRQPS